MKARKKAGTAPPSISHLKEELRKEKYREQYIKMLRSTVSTLLVAAAAAVLMATLWLPVVRIVGNSMAPTVENGEIVICLKTNHAQPGELVSFYVGNTLLVKRCIAREGQLVDMDEAGNVYVDGMLLQENYLREKAVGTWETPLPCQVPAGTFFCLGDHRLVSVDSRSNTVGCIAQDQITGRPLLRIWPLSRFGWVK